MNEGAEMQDMNFDSVDVAAYIVKQCAANNYYIDLTKLQKILFACYGAFLAVTGKRLCKEHPRAWPHGPVFPRVYNYTKKHIDFIQDLLKREESIATSMDSKIVELINYTISFFSNYRAGELVRWSHQIGSPWDIATSHGRKLQGEIPDELIADYFKKNLTKNDE